MDEREREVLQRRKWRRSSDRGKRRGQKFWNRSEPSII